MDDDPFENLAAVLPRATSFLAERLAADDSVLVHCFLGQNRSVAVCVAYMMMDGGLSLLDAVERVAAARGRILGSGSFQLQLARLGTEIQRETSQNDIPVGHTSDEFNDSSC